MTKPTFGSLFAGVGGIDLGFEAAGWECRFQVEWDPACQQTLAHHWPDIPRWGDVAGVSGRDLPPVDLITFGSPCQDLSTAGKRAGLVEGSRSNLFFEATRIIKEMRDATANAFPRWALWENVPGALSSNGGADFGAVLDEMADLGALAVEWHCLDAQFFGVPQRRRRVFVLACLDPRIAKRGRQQVLPVPEGRRRHSQASKRKGQDPAGAPSEGPRGTGIEGNRTRDGHGTGVVGALLATDYWKGIRNQTLDENKLMLEEVDEPTLPRAFQPGQILRNDQKLSEIAPTLLANNKSGDNEPHVIVEDSSVYVKGRRAHTPDDFETWDEGEVAPTLNSSDNRTDGRATVLITVEQPEPTSPESDIILFDADRRHGARVIEDGIAPTLMAFMGTGGNNVPLVATEPTLLRMREGKPGGGKGPLLSEGISLTLATGNDLVLFAPVEDDSEPTPPQEVGVDGKWWDGSTVAPTLTVNSVNQTMPDKGQWFAVVQTPIESDSIAIPIQGTIIGRGENAGPQGRGVGDPGDPMYTLDTISMHGVAQEVPMAIPIQDGRDIEKHQNGLGIGAEGDPSYTLDQTGSQSVAQEVIAFEPGALARGLSGDRWSTEVTPTLRAEMGDNHPAVAYAFPSTFSNNTVSEETFPTITVGSSIGISSPPAVAYSEDVAIPIAHGTLRGGGVARRPSPDGRGGESIRHPGFGLGEDGDPMYAVTTTPPAVATNTKETDMTDTPYPKLVVRRLTPTECERLMGWPDGHTLHRADGKENADSTRYKMCGNGVASPVAEWIARYILKAQEKMDEIGDGE